MTILERMRHRLDHPSPELYDYEIRDHRAVVFEVRTGKEVSCFPKHEIRYARQIANAHNLELFDHDEGCWHVGSEAEANYLKGQTVPPDMIRRKN